MQKNCNKSFNPRQGDRSTKLTPSQKLLAEMVPLLERKHNFARGKNNRLWRKYINGQYWPDGEEFVTWRVRTILEEQGRLGEWRSGICREIVKCLLASAPQLRDVEQGI